MYDEEPDRDPHGECRVEIQALRAEVDRLLKQRSEQIDYCIGLQRLIETLARGETPVVDDTHMSSVAAKAAAKLAEAKRLGLEACEVASAEWTPLACDAAGITAIAAALEKL